MLEYQDLWNQVKDILKKKLSPNTFEQTFGEVKKVVNFENGIIYVLAPSQYIKHTINSAHYRNVENILNSINNKKYKLKFICEEELKINKVNPNYPKLSKNNLNLNYTFESFVVGNSNKISYLTSIKVAQNPGYSFNPLYIFGGVGLGKTHLMQAIGNYISESNPEYKILYVQANEFLDDYTKSSRDRNFKAWEEKYENIDVFLIDDIQMLTGKEGSQEQFFKLFNELDNKNKQIVITSDRPANKLNKFMDRLTSRFQTGITVNIEYPDLIQRINILKRKLSERSNINLSDDILEYIAETFTDNVRELEGALNRVLLYAEFNNSEPNLQLAIEALEIISKNKKTTNYGENYQDALSIISNMYNITIYDLLGTSRNAKYVLPRHIAMYILYTKYDLTYENIGNIFNGKNHTTVMNGCNKIKEELKTNEELKMAIESILKKV